MSAIKKAFEAVHAHLAENHPTVLEDSTLVKLMTAKTGGFSGEDSFVTVDGNKVARICALTGAVFAHDNTDKEVSYFYKNGSYAIPAEVIKAQAKKAFDTDKLQALDLLEEDMLEGNLTPQEWKEAKTAEDAKTFEFTISDEDKQMVIDTFDGYPSKEAFLEDYNAGNVRPFSDFADDMDAIRTRNEEDTEEA